MTKQKHLKKLVRARMGKTKESYTTARRALVGKAEDSSPAKAFPYHFPGTVPAATALRVLLAHRGAATPPWSEPLVFGLAGGIGVGCCAFYYKKEDFASFFITGRHLWQDDLAYLKNACGRLGLSPLIRETTSAKLADKHLRDLLAMGPCIAWVDMAHLPHRAMPQTWSGGGYHVVTIYRIDDAEKVAWIGDLSAAPIAVPLADLAKARGRIAKQKNRLLALAEGTAPADWKEQVTPALRACHDGLEGKLGIRAYSMFSLEAVREWGERMYASKDKQAWEVVFPPGARLWNGLTMMHDFIEHYGGGGLCRPLFAEYLSQAGAALKSGSLVRLSSQYAALGRRWSDLADSALPDGVPAFRRVKELAARKKKLTRQGGKNEEIHACWAELEALGKEAKTRFPLLTTECDELRRGLKEKILAIHEEERAAAKAIERWVKEQ